MHTPPLRQPGSHLARDNKTEKTFTFTYWQTDCSLDLSFFSWNMTNQMNKNWINSVIEIQALVRRRPTGEPKGTDWLCKLTCLCLWCKGPKKRMSWCDHDISDYYDSTHPLCRGVLPSQSYSSTSPSECSVHSYNVWSRPSSAALVAPRDDGTLSVCKVCRGQSHVNTDYISALFN